MNETLNVFIISNNTNMGMTENKKLEQQASGRHRNFEMIVENASENQFIGNKTDDRIRDAVDSAVMAVENRMHDAILTAVNDVVIPRVEMAVISSTGSSRNGPNSIVHNPEWRNFTGNTENTPLKSASSRLDLKIDQDVIDENRDIYSSVDDHFPATRFNYDRRAHAHHTGCAAGQLIWTAKERVARKNKTLVVLITRKTNKDFIWENLETWTEMIN